MPQSPEVRRASERARYANDPAYRQRRSEQHRARYASDPAYRERLQANTRRSRERRRDALGSEGVSTSNGTVAGQSSRPVPAAAPAGVDSPAGVGSPAGGKDVPPRGRTAAGKTLTAAQRAVVHAGLKRAFEAPNMAFTLASMVGAEVDPRYPLHPQEIEQLANVWADVIALYPKTIKWFEQGTTLSAWSVALFTTTWIVLPRVDIDLTKRVPRLTPRRDVQEAARGNGRVAVPVPNAAAAVPATPDAATVAGGAGDPPGGTRLDGGYNGIGENDARAITIGRA